MTEQERETQGSGKSPPAQIFSEQSVSLQAHKLTRTFANVGGIWREIQNHKGPPIFAWRETSVKEDTVEPV